MKKIFTLTLIFLMAVSAVFAGGNREKNPALKGKITIYTSMYGDIVRAIGEEIKKQFPDYEIEFFYGGTGTVQARIESERAANRLGCDILLVAEPAYSLELKELGILHPYISKEAENLAFDYDRDGYWYPVRVSNMILAYNPERYSRNSIPNSLYDFAHNASVRGAISMSNPLTSGTSMATVLALRDKYGYDYFDALGKQNIAIESGAIALAKLETGVNKVVMVLEESVLKKREEEGSKLEVIYPTDGVVVIPSTIMIVNDKWNANRNTKLAEAITDWFLSPVGQSAIVSAWMHSVRVDFPKLPYDAIPTSEILANSIPVNWENCFYQREEILDKFEELITNRR
jgi:iron(III) transport system substrate-binding protein